MKSFGSALGRARRRRECNSTRRDRRGV
jgi:hypothetical protein